MPDRYRKKPVVIEAWRFDGSWCSGKDILDWMNPGWSLEVSKPRWSDKNGGELYIPTLEGEMTASAGDFVIKGVQGEFYPCKPEIFHATYEPV